MAGREIVLIGERDLSIRAHVGIEASISLFQQAVDPNLRYRWVSTGEFTVKNTDRLLSSAAGIWCTPGSPYESTEGALQAIRYAREHQQAFLGTCGGFQHALMEFYQNVLGHEAAHQEVSADAANPLIIKLTCSLVGASASIRPVHGTEFAKILGADQSMEEFNCNYGIAPSLQPAFSGSEMKFVAHDLENQVRAFQLSGHPFFVGTLFQPERRAFGGALHPVVNAFLTNSRFLL